MRLALVGRFDEPLYVTAPRGDRRRIFVVEQGGRIMVVRGGRKLAEPFLDISSQVQSGGEQGLLSMAFAPDYETSGLFYVYFTDNDGDSASSSTGAASADRADAGSARVVLVMQDPEGNHNGGLLLFGPDDLMYVGTGDGGGAGDQHGPRGNAQNLGSLLGKILRIDPRRDGGRPYRVPGRTRSWAGPARAPEIWSYGLRNPWRFSFDRRTGDLTIGDVGQGDVEEIDFVRSGRGRNFGWRPFEGRRRYTPGESAPGHVRPIIQRFHDDGNCSITGGVVVRDRGLPALRGRYVFGDFCVGRIETARVGPRRARRQRRTRLRVDSLSSFGEDARGRVYVTSLGGPGVPALGAAPMSLDASGSPALRADNPGPYTLDGTNTWVLGRDPAWVVDPGPALGEHLDAVAAEVAARGGAGGIALTHDHADHAEGTAALRERLGGVPVAAARGEVDVTLADGDELRPADRRRGARPRRRPPRVRGGPRVLHRRRGARRGQRVRRRAAARVPGGARAPARARPRRAVPRPRPARVGAGGQAHGVPRASRGARGEARRRARRGPAHPRRAARRRLGRRPARPPRGGRADARRAPRQAAGGGPAAVRTATYDEHPLGLTWTVEEPMERSSHALAADGRVWLVDPVEVSEALERVAGLGEPAGVIQLLDRHGRSCARLAQRLGVPHHVVPDSVPGSPFEAIPLVRFPGWRETALWWPEREALVVAEVLGANSYYTAGDEPVAVHFLVRALPPGRLRGYRPQHLLMGHGPPVHGDAAAEGVGRAYARSRRDLPRVLARLPRELWSAR